MARRQERPEIPLGPTTGTWFHATPSVNRASIARLGLLGIPVIGGPRRPWFSITGQPAGLYLTSTSGDAVAYIRHAIERKTWAGYLARPHAGREEALARRVFEGGDLSDSDWDIWRVRLAGEEAWRDQDWPGAAAIYVRADVPPARIELATTWDFVREAGIGDLTPYLEELRRARRR